MENTFSRKNLCLVKIPSARINLSIQMRFERLQLIISFYTIMLYVRKVNRKLYPDKIPYPVQCNPFNGDSHLEQFSFLKILKLCCKDFFNTVFSLYIFSFVAYQLPFGRNFVDALLKKCTLKILVHSESFYEQKGKKKREREEWKKIELHRYRFGTVESFERRAIPVARATTMKHDSEPNRSNNLIPAAFANEENGAYGNALNTRKERERESTRTIESDDRK